MKFLCLCHYDVAKHAACTPADFERIKAKCATHDAQLYADPGFVAVGSFAEPTDYAVIHPGDEGPTVTSGPYAQTPEPFGAFFLVEADSLEQAIEIAKLHPGAHLGREFGGGIEVRPCRYFMESPAAAK
jgi:hypothetical protein